MDNPQGQRNQHECQGEAPNDYQSATCRKVEGIVYSPNKYRETEGTKDLGENFWNKGRTEEIKNRYVHLGAGE